MTGPWFSARKRAKRIVFRAKLNGARVRNWLAGYAWSPIQICRSCGHTVYETDRVTRTTCRYCPEAANSQAGPDQ